ncbi:hypothetical protein V8D89_000921 [Ganoderma adspersum]
MRTPYRGRYAAVIILLAARATSGQRVGNDDPGIEYRGLWVHNTFSDDDSRPEALVGTNVSGSTATYSFRGTGISVFGAFPVAGTFNIRSTYSIDGGTPKDLLPADTITTPTFHQKFFEVDTLSDDEHTLVITNAGQDYWLDYLAVTTTQSAPSPTTTTGSTTHATSSTTTTAKSTTLQTTKTPSPSTAQPIPPITDSASTSAAAGRQTTATQSVPGSPSQDTHSFSNAANATLTSTDAVAAAPSAHANSTRPSQASSALTSGTASPTSTPARGHSTKFPAGAIAGLAVAGCLAFIVVALVGYRWGRRKQGRSRIERHDGLPSTGPGPTTLAFERSEKQDLAHNENSGFSVIGIRVSRSTSEHEGAGEITTTNPDGTNVPRDRRTVFDSPSSAPPLILQHPEPAGQKSAPIPESVESSQYVVPCEGRRSVDGGVRLAGGPPGDVRAFDDQEDVRSGMSTLPPEYQVYPAA